MPKPIFMVFRQLIAPNGTGCVIPLKAFAQESDALKACEILRDGFSTMATGVVVVDGKAVTTVSNLMAELGVKTVGFNYIKAEMSESMLLEARPNIILAG